VCHQRAGPGKAAGVSTSTASADERVVRALQPAQSLDRHGRADEAFPGLFQLYKRTLHESGLRYTIFGHIGDNHVHVNILPRNDSEAARARELYVEYLKYAAS